MSARRAVKIRATKLSHLHRRRAELSAQLAEIDAEIARIFENAASNETSVELDRKPPAAHEPVLKPVSDADRIRARAVIRDAGLRRRLRA